MPVEWNENFMPQFRAEVVTPALEAALITGAEYAKAQMPQMTLVSSQYGNAPHLKRGKSTRYTSSRPGGYPGRRTQHLYRSMTHAAPDPTQPRLVGSFGVYGGRRGLKHRTVTGTAKGYGRYLEFGTKRMRPRPYLKPTAERAPMAEAFTRTAKRNFAQTFGGGA